MLQMHVIATILYFIEFRVGSFCGMARWLMPMACEVITNRSKAASAASVKIKAPMPLHIYRSTEISATDNSQ